MASIELDMIQTAGIGGLALIVGMILTRKVAFLQRFCVFRSIISFLAIYVDTSCVRRTKAYSRSCIGKNKQSV